MPDDHPIRSALLRGHEHTWIGRIGAVAETPAAIALSRGGAQKTYRYKDPNEDAALFATSAWGGVVAVTDGHAGHHAARIVLERVLDHHATRWLEVRATDLAERWESEIPDLLVDLNQAVLGCRDAGVLDAGETTLALAVVRPREDRIAYLSVGDSHIFQVERGGVRELARSAGERVGYLGNPGDDPQRLRTKCRSGIAPLGELRALVLATDGLSELGIGVPDPAAAVSGVVVRAERAAPDRRPLEVARGVAECALDAQRSQQAGDNVATAVYWVG